MNYIADYIPILSALTPAQLKAGRDKAVAFVRQALPDVEFAPGSPSGDALITPMGLLFAGIDEAHRRHMSDLDLGNVAAGVIYSCDFVRAFLGNFGVYDVDRAAGYGVVRLTFSTNGPRTIPVHTLFRFGTADFRLVSSSVSAITITACGDAPDSPDSYELAQTSATTWAVDVPVAGGDSSVVSAGDACVLSLTVPGLTGAVAAVDFATGVPAAGLPELADMARKTAWAVNSPTRNGIASSVWRNWPESKMVSPVVTGDAEMVRIVSTGPTIIQAPAVDVYFRSQYDMQVARQTVRLTYGSCLENTVERGRFRGPVTFLGRPSKVISIEWAGTSVESLVESSLMISEPEAVGLVGERFHISVTPVLDGATGLPEIPLTEDADGVYAMFTITYAYDPALSHVQRTLENTENAPVGVSLKVVPGPLVDISEFVVEFARQPGVKVLTQSAAESISQAVSESGFPSVFGQSVVHSIMRQAGAGRVKSVTCSATAKCTPSSRVFAEDTEPSTADIWADWISESAPVTSLSLNISNLLSQTVTHNDHDGMWMEHWVLSDKTARLFLPEAAIEFIES